MKPFRFKEALFFLLFLVLLGIGVYQFFLASPSPERARKELVRLGYNYEPAGLFAAIRDGNHKAVKLFLASGMELNLYDRSGFTPLIFAIRRNNPAVVQLLLKNGADPNLPDGRGRLPLGYAVLQGSLELAKILLDNGADPNRRDEEGFTALALAMRNKSSPQLIELLKARGGTL